MTNYACIKLVKKWLLMTNTVESSWRNNCRYQICHKSNNSARDIIHLAHFPFSTCQPSSHETDQYLDLFYGDISLNTDGNSYRKCEGCGARYKMFSYLDQVTFVIVCYCWLTFFVCLFVCFLGHTSFSSYSAFALQYFFRHKCLKFLNIWDISEFESQADVEELRPPSYKKAPGRIVFFHIIVVAHCCDVQFHRCRWRLSYCFH